MTKALLEGCVDLKSAVLIQKLLHFNYFTYFLLYTTEKII